MMALQLKVPNMACSACGDKITQAIRAIDPAATVRPDPKTKLVEVDTEAAETAVRDAIITAGYSITD